jgi:hypothetical protein
MPPAGGNLSAALPKSWSERFDNIVRKLFPWPLSGLTKLSDPIFLHFRHDCRKSTVQKTGSAMLPDPILLWTFDKIIRSPLDP